MKYMGEFFLKIKNIIFQNPLLFGMLFLAVFLAGFLAGAFVKKESELSFSSKNKPERQKSSEYKFTSPLLDCDYFGGPFSIKSNAMKDVVEKIIENKTKEQKVETVAVYFRDLSNGPTMGINEAEKFTPASLLKITALISFLKEAEKNPGFLKEKVVFKETRENPKDIVLQNIKPQGSLENGKEYSIEELLERMIIYSDNQASNFLLDKFENISMEKTFHDLKAGSSLFKEDEDFMNIKEYASFFRVLYNASYLSREMSEKALEILSKVQYKNGLVAKLPKEISVAHKFGERGVLGGLYQLHDCGVIYHPSFPYILCVMSKGDNFKELEDVISSISEEVFREVDKGE